MPTSRSELRPAREWKPNLRGPGGVVKTGWTMLKIGILSAFCPNFPMEFGSLDLKNLGKPSRQATGSPPLRLSFYF